VRIDVCWGFANHDLGEHGSTESDVVDGMIGPAARNTLIDIGIVVLDIENTVRRISILISECYKRKRNWQRAGRPALILLSIRYLLLGKHVLSGMFVLGF
jgi:hypothetical protein